MRPLPPLSLLVALCSVACNGARTSGQPAATLASASASTPASAPALAPVPAGSSSTAPPYDLAADLRLRTQFARMHIPDGARIRVVGDVFLFAAGDDGSTFEPSVRLAEKALAALYDGRFSRHPRQAVTVYVFDYRDTYDDSCRARHGSPCASPYGLYDEHTREIFADQSFGDSRGQHDRPRARPPPPRGRLPARPALGQRGDRLALRAPRPAPPRRDPRHHRLAPAAPAPGARQSARTRRRPPRCALSHARRPVRRRRRRADAVVCSRPLRLPVARLAGPPLALLPDVARP